MNSEKPLLTIAEFLFDSVSEPVLARNVYCENEFDSHERDRKDKTHFHMNGSVQRLDLTQSKANTEIAYLTCQKFWTLNFEPLIFGPFYLISDKLRTKI